MKTITYNPETHVLVPREPSEEMCDAATADSCWENMNPPPSTAYRSMLAAAPQPEPVDVEPAMWVMKHIRSGDLAQAKPNQKALHPRMWSKAHLYTTPQPDRVAELEAALKVARDGIDKFIVANDPTEFGCACDLSVGYLCGPCHADKLRAELAEKDEVIAEAGEMLAMRDRQLAELKERRCEVCGYAEHHREHTGCLRKQVSSLKAELREICAAIDDPAGDLTLTAVECIKKLKAENESLRRDAERLDFILRKQLIVIQDCDDKYFTYNAQSGKRGPEMDSEAEAIDAAMAQGEK